MLLMRQCQSATMHSRRLARDLGLIDDSP
jgi:hypothetical protein